MLRENDGIVKFHGFIPISLLRFALSVYKDSPNNVQSFLLFQHPAPDFYRSASSVKLPNDKQASKRV